MTRVGRFVAAAFMWSVLAAAGLVGAVVVLLLLGVAGLVRGVCEVGRVLLRRGETSDVPDGLDEVLRGRIDGDDEAYDVDLFCCGCPRAAQPEYGCVRCDWVTCHDHRFAPHLCERDAAAEAFNTNPRGDAVSLDQRLDVMGAALVGEIYEYLESQR